MFNKKKESTKVLSFFNPRHIENRKLFTNGGMTSELDEYLEKLDVDLAVYREAQILIKDTLRHYVEQKQSLRTVISMFLADTEQVLYVARKSCLYGLEPGMNIHTHGVLHDELESENYIHLDTGHKDTASMAITYHHGSIRIRFNGERMFIPIVLGEEEYFQMQVLYPWLIMSFEEYELFRSIIEYVSTDSPTRFRYHYIRLAVDFSLLLFNYALCKLKIVESENLKYPTQE